MSEMLFSYETIKIDKKSAKMIAHRGCSGIECENTCAAFVLAGAKTYFGIETDVHKTLDGKYLICHDSDIFRMCGVHKRIEECTFESLRKYQLANPRTGETRGDLIFPSLAEYISICKKYGKRAVLELKSDFDGASVKEICDIINSFGYFYRVTFISFFRGALINVRGAYPDADLQFLTGEMSDSDFEFMKKYNISLDVAHNSVDKALVDKVHDAKLKINCWTVDEQSRAEELISFGVDYITSNILE